MACMADHGLITPPLTDARKELSELTLERAIPTHITARALPGDS